MWKGITVTTEDRYIQLRIVELEGLLLLINRTVLLHWHVLLTTDWTRISSGLLWCLSSLSSRVSGNYKRGKTHIFTPITTNTELIVLIQSSPILSKSKLLLKVFFTIGSRCTNVYLKIDDVFFICLFISGDIGEIGGCCELICDFSDEVDELFDAMWRSKGVYLFSNELNFPYLCGFRERGILVEKGEEKMNG